MFTNRFRATRYMKVKRMGITEILRRIWLFSASNIKSSESGSKRPTQLTFELNSLLWHIIVTIVLSCHMIIATTTRVESHCITAHSSITCLDLVSPSRFGSVDHQILASYILHTICLYKVATKYLHEHRL